MRDTDKGPARHAPLWMRVTLGVSLALNLLVAGLAVGAALRLGGSGAGRAHPKIPGGVIYGELSRADRRALFGQVRDASRERRRQRREEALAVSDLLRAKPFDAAAMQELLSVHRRAQNGWREEVQRAWLQRVTRMSDAERAGFADRIAHTTQRIRARRDDGADKP